MTPPSLESILDEVVTPALSLLPKNLDTPPARVQLLATGLQESGFLTRRQAGGGPANGYLQFELGTKASCGGVTGVFMHRSSNELLRLLCRDRDCNFDPRAIWSAMASDDVLGMALGRLLLLTDSKPLPELGDADGAWEYYIRNWNPGRPRPSEWGANYAAALEAVK